MRQIRNYGDKRQTEFCVHCGGSTETRDHAPSKILLDKPYPTNLPVLPSCAECNEGFSLNEEYTACFIECALCGSTDPDEITRDAIKKILRSSSSLRAFIERSKKEASTIGGGRILVWEPNQDRISQVILKLARCHTAFELNEPRLEKPSHLMILPLISMTDEQRDHFEAVPDTGVWPEVGSRAMLRLIEGDEAYVGGWIDVQDGRYRYMAVAGGDILIRGVLSEYLAYEVIWE